MKSSDFRTKFGFKLLHGEKISDEETVVGRKIILLLKIIRSKKLILNEVLLNANLSSHDL